MRAELIAASLTAALACTPRSGQEGAPAEASVPADAGGMPGDATPAGPSPESAAAETSPSTEPAGEAPPGPNSSDRPQSESGGRDGGRDGVNGSGDGSTNVAEATPPATPPAPGSLRLVVLHAPPDLLKSQARQVLAMEEELREQGLKVTREAARADERSYAEAGGEGAALPAGWEGFETVVLLRLAEPAVNRRGKRLARGLRDLLVVRPPTATPVLSDRSSAEAGVRLQGKVQARWVASILAGLRPQGEER